MQFNTPEFESHGGRLEAFDDGHCPETFRFHKDDNHNENDNMLTPRIVRYDEICQSSSQSKSPSSRVHIYDNILNPNDARMLYEVTAVGESPWGTYVKTTEALEWIEWKNRDAKKCNTPSHTITSSIDEHLVDWREKMLRFRQWRKLREGIIDEVEQESQGCHNQLDDVDYIRHALAVEAVATFFIELIPSQAGSVPLSANFSSNQSARREKLYELPSFLNQVHGIAVWALSSIAGQSVSYHIDYAELLRYEYNVTVPPLWAGTIQCSNLMNRQKVDNDNARSGEHIMEGGEFCVNLRGLNHYAEHGYKGNLSGDPTGGWKRPEGQDACAQYVEVGVHMNDEDQWVTIPYLFNRGIVHHGDLPHLSAPITSISTHKSDVSSTSRVIVGFNAFGHDVGAQIANAPEHSKLFRRKVRLYRSTINSTKGMNLGINGRVQDGMNLSQIRQNKGLMKLLVLAKREKVKLELRRNQEQLSLRIWQRLLRHHHHQQHIHDNTRLLLRISDIVDEFGSRNDGIDGAWPKSIDVHVHLHHMLVSTTGGRNVFLDEDGIWYCMQAASMDSSASSSSGVLNSKAEESSMLSRLTPLSTYLCIHRTSSNITN